MARGGRIKESKRVDAVKLKTVLREKGITFVELSEEMGFAKNYISSCINKTASISKFTIQYLKNKYGISYDDYRYVKASEPIIKEEQEQQEQSLYHVQSADTIASMSKEDFAKLISESVYQAVYSAITHAWKDV